MRTLPRFSFGVGDRFGHEATAQLSAFQQLARAGIQVAPVWNKSHREHGFIGSHPEDVRAAAASAIVESGWDGPWYVDADHIRLDTVDGYLESSDFFTIDVADSIGQPADESDIRTFISAHPELCKPGFHPWHHQGHTSFGRRYRGVLSGSTTRPAETRRRSTTISLRNEVTTLSSKSAWTRRTSHKTPPELLVILALLADEKIPVQTVAPKFTGRFNKGVDYVGDLGQFEQEFSDDVAVCSFAVQQYGLPDTLKLSVHSGSDKFSLYPIIRRVLKATGAGVHLKTAGTTWLEELIGLAEAGGDGLQLVRDVYRYAIEHRDELCGPYATVIDIDPNCLLSVEDFGALSGPDTAATIRHIQNDKRFNPHVRQLLHIAFKVAAGEGARYTDLLKEHRAIVADQVTTNLYERHLLPLFAV